MIDFITITPGQGMTVADYFNQPALATVLKKDILAFRIESSTSDFCLTCLCIYDQDGGCMCTKYARNSAGDYIAKQEAK